MTAIFKDRLILADEIGVGKNRMNGKGNDERVIVVDDHGLMDMADDEYESIDALTSEFRHQLGRLTEEEKELSDVFKARVGLLPFDQDRLEFLATEKQVTVEKYRFENFANKYFQNGMLPKYTSELLQHPILKTEDPVDQKAALSLWIAIQRFTEARPFPVNESSKPNSSVMTRVCRQLSPQSSPAGTPTSSISPNTSASNSPMSETSPTVFGQVIEEPTNIQKNHTDSKKTKSEKWSLKKLLFRSQSSDKSKKKNIDLMENGSYNPSSSSDDVGPSKDKPDPDYEDLHFDIPHSELDLVNFIVSHGIVKPSLRDEIFCQLCCYVTNNPSEQSCERGWMLHALCAGCFLPSSQLMNYYFGFLHCAPKIAIDFSRYIMVMLRRTNMNGMRYHPPSWVELQAVKLRKYPVLQVGLPDGRMIPIECDPATTAWEICVNIADAFGLRDHFGFSVYVGVNRRISSLGSGSDHVMDAISECEQMLRVEQGISEDSAPWRIYYQKELFTPWHDPTADEISTELIYRQIVDGVRRGEYSLMPEEIPKIVSRFLFVDHGSDVNADLIKSNVSDYLPGQLLSNSRARDSLCKSILVAFETRGYSAGILSKQQVHYQIVSMATALWPMNFSAMFEASRRAGPRLACNDVVIAVNGDGVFLLDHSFKTLIGFHYYDIVDVTSCGTLDVRTATVDFVTIDGAEFSFYAPNAETVAKIISAYLDGLRRRSRWGVVLQSFQLKDYTDASDEDFSLKQGDIVELMDEAEHPVLCNDWLYGRCDRTSTCGSFPYETIYILPTSEKPDDKFLVPMFSQQYCALHYNGTSTADRLQLYAALLEKLLYTSSQTTTTSISSVRIDVDVQDMSSQTVSLDAGIDDTINTTMIAAHAGSIV